MIRKALEKDVPKIIELLKQVCAVHHQCRPDLFKGDGAAKYTEDEIKSILRDPLTPVFVYVAETDETIGYAFCKFIHANNNALADIKTLYVDDLCVDENHRGLHVGTALYDYVVNFAKQNSCYNVTLNVWACNKSAISFYEKLGLKQQKIGMETIL